MNPSNGNSRARRESVLLRLVFWMAIGLVVVVYGGACAALPRPAKARHLEIAPDPPAVCAACIRSAGLSAPSPPEAQLVCAL